MGKDTICDTICPEKGPREVLFQISSKFSEDEILSPSDQSQRWIRLPAISEFLSIFVSLASYQGYTNIWGRDLRRDLEIFALLKPPIISFEDLSYNIILFCAHHQLVS